MLILILMTAKMQLSEVVRGPDLFLSEFSIPQGNPTQPVSERVKTEEPLCAELTDKPARGIHYNTHRRVNALADDHLSGIPLRCDAAPSF